MQDLGEMYARDWSNFPSTYLALQDTVGSETPSNSEISHADVPISAEIQKRFPNAIKPRPWKRAKTTPLRPKVAIEQRKATPVQKGSKRPTRASGKENIAPKYRQGTQRPTKTMTRNRLQPDKSVPASKHSVVPNTGLKDATSKRCIPKISPNMDLGHASEKQGAENITALR